MWVDSKVYFISDRDGSVATLFAYDLQTKKVERVLEPNGSDIKSASACADAIAFDRLDGVYLFDLKEKKAKKVDIKVQGDLPGVRLRFEKVGDQIQNVGLSPTGTRVVFEAHGEILTAPAEKGDVRNLTNSPGVADRDPAWSPDGKTIAYFSDESGEYELHLKPQNGLGDVKKFKLGDAPSFYYSPRWSPDGKRIAYGDKRKNLWYIDLDTGKSTKVDSDPIALGNAPQAEWSPDSKWIAYVRPLKSSLGAVFLYSLADGKVHQITDGMSEARAVAFDKSGKYLYMLASTDSGPASFGSMSAFNRALCCAEYLIVLKK
jgi:tricorn protease